jgi:hypothetical protein
MPPITDPNLLQQLETPQTRINSGGMPARGGGGGGGGINSQLRSQAIGKVAAARSLQRQLDRVQQLYDKHLKGVGLSSAAEYFPSQGNKEFDAAASSLVPTLRQLARVPGSGADSDKELEILTKNVPDRYKFDADNEERIRTLRGYVNDALNNYGPIAYPDQFVSPTIQRIRR